jgi:hypothetical protein
MSGVWWRSTVRTVGKYRFRAVSAVWLYRSGILGPCRSCVGTTKTHKFPKLAGHLTNLHAPQIQKLTTPQTPSPYGILGSLREVIRRTTECFSLPKKSQLSSAKRPKSAEAVWILIDIGYSIPVWVGVGVVVALLLSAVSFLVLAGVVFVLIAVELILGTP